MILNGEYTKQGVAINDVAYGESINRFQKALGLFNDYVKSMKVPRRDISVQPIALVGGFAKGRGRIGIYNELSFEAVHEMQEQAKGRLRNGFRRYIGEHWSGCERDIYHYPSDLDILVKYDYSKPISIGLSWKIDDMVKEICKKIFHETNVYISLHGYEYRNFLKEQIPLEEVIDGGVKWLKNT